MYIVKKGMSVTALYGKIMVTVIATQQELIDYMGEYDFLYTDEYEYVLDELCNGFKVRLTKSSSHWIKLVPDDVEEWL